MPDDVEAARRMTDAFNEHGWDGLFPFLHEDFEFHEPPEQPGATVFRGQEEARKGWAKWAEAWVEQTLELEELIELPDGRILTLTITRVRGRDGIALEQHGANLTKLRDGKVVELRSYWSRDTAREAAGLT